MVKFGPSLADILPNAVDVGRTLAVCGAIGFGRVRATFGRIRHIGDSGTSSADSGQRLVEFGRTVDPEPNSVGITRLLCNFLEFGLTLTVVRPYLPSLVEVVTNSIRAHLARNRSESAYFGPHLVQLRPGSGQLWRISTRAGPMWAKNSACNCMDLVPQRWSLICGSDIPRPRQGSGRKETHLRVPRGERESQRHERRRSARTHKKRREGSGTVDGGGFGQIWAEGGQTSRSAWSGQAGPRTGTIAPSGPPSPVRPMPRIRASDLLASPPRQGLLAVPLALARRPAR